MADGAILGQQAITVPTGDIAARPASPTVGMVRYNTETGALENYTTNGWLKVSIQIPTISSTSGRIVAGWTSALTFNGLNYGSSGTVTATFTGTGLTQTTATGTSNSSGTSVTINVPSAIYNNVTAGNAVNVTVQNQDGGVSASTAFTAVALPTGGSITTSSIRMFYWYGAC